ncbi:MAG: sugar phosphate isomerase/epimerase [bacterium]|nr:sugar phosphate isomerase/epimerase [bacterium]
MIETRQDSQNFLAKLGFRLAGFRTWPLDKSLKALAKIGYKSVEFCLEHPELDPDALTPEKITKIKKVLDTQDLRVSAVSSHHLEDTVGDALIKQKRALAIAREFGCNLLVTGTVRDRVDPDGFATYRALEELLNAAEVIGVIVALEPEPDTVLNGMYEFSQFAGRVAGSKLGLNLNVGHCYLTEGNPIEVIDEWGSFIVQTHFADMRRPDHVHLLPGDGHMDLPGLIQKLRDQNYHGDLVVDLLDITDAPDQWAQQAFDRCKGLLS